MLHRRQNLPFFGNLAEKASCVDDKTVLFRYTYSYIVFQSFASNPYHNVIRPYHLKKGQNPYWIRKIRTRWHVCKWQPYVQCASHLRTMHCSRTEKVAILTSALSFAGCASAFVTRSLSALVQRCAFVLVCCASGL